MIIAGGAAEQAIDKTQSSHRATNCEPLWKQMSANIVACVCLCLCRCVRVWVARWLWCDKPPQISHRRKKNAAVPHTLGTVFTPSARLSSRLWSVWSVCLLQRCNCVLVRLFMKVWGGVGDVCVLSRAASFPPREFRGNEYKWRLRPLFNYFLITREQCGSFIFACVCLTAPTLSRECFRAASSAICLSWAEPPKVQKTQKSDWRCFSCFSGNFFSSHCWNSELLRHHTKVWINHIFIYIYIWGYILFSQVLSLDFVQQRRTLVWLFIASFGQDCLWRAHHAPAPFCTKFPIIVSVSRIYFERWREETGGGRWAIGLQLPPEIRCAAKAWNLR